MMPSTQARPIPRRSFNARFNAALQRFLVRLKIEEVPHIKRVIITVVGGTVVILGAVMIVTPGPAVLVIPAGLAILGTEYAWARRWLRRARKMGRKAVSQTKSMFAPRPAGNSELPVPPVSAEPAPIRQETVGTGKLPS